MYKNARCDVFLIKPIVVCFFFFGRSRCRPRRWTLKSLISRLDRVDRLGESQCLYGKMLAGKECDSTIAKG